MANPARVRVYVAVQYTRPDKGQARANPDQIDSLAESAAKWGVEEVFAESVNGRGPGPRLTQEALNGAGYAGEARAIEAIRKKEAWSLYVRDLIANLQRSVRRHHDIERLRVRLYPANLTLA